MLKKKIATILMHLPSIYLIHNIFFRFGSFGRKESLQAIHNNFVNTKEKSTVAVDFGCGTIPQNKFNAKKVIGLDLRSNKKNGVLQVRVGFERLPFDDDSIDYLTAYDLLEHIQRHVELPGKTTTHLSSS